MWEHRDSRNLERIADYLEEVVVILHKLVIPRPKSATLTLKTPQGDTKLPLTVHVNDKPGIAVYQEWDGPNGTGNKVPPTGQVAYSSDNPSVATVDPASGQLAYVAAGVANISASDSGNLPAQDALTVVASAAASSTLTLNPGV